MNFVLLKDLESDLLIFGTGLRVMNLLSTNTMRRLMCERGQSTAIVAISMLVLLGFVGLTVDAGLLFHAKRTMQAAADAAAKIAGVSKVLLADAAQLEAGLAENVQATVMNIAKDYTHILGNVVVKNA